MEWRDDFLVYATVGDTLLRTLFDEGTHEIEGYVPALNNDVMTILNTGPIHMHTPQQIPLCVECRKETDNVT